MKKQNGFSLIGILFIIGALIVTTGGVVVWREKISPTPIPTPTPISEPTPKTQPVIRGDCFITGCNGELCVDESRKDLTTICRWLPEHACLKTAICERQADGSCGFTQTPELKVCLDKFRE